jgi:serine protease Do
MSKTSRTTRSLLLASAAVAGLGITLPAFAPLPAGAAVETRGDSLIGDNGSLVEIVRRDKPAIVTVEVTGARPEGRQMRGEMPENAPPEMRQFFRQFFGENGPQGAPEGDGRMRGVGSGFIVSADGTIVTNNHVIDGAERIKVTLDDGRSFDAKVVGSDSRTDIAVLKVEATGLPYVIWGDSDAVEVGETVVAMGNPFGVGTTVTSGILSARGRDLNNGPYDDFLQVDAAINHGNSGGALFSADGKVVGITSAIFTPNDGNVGIGFAIPSVMAERVVADLMDDGSIQRGYLGVRIQPVDDTIAQAMGLDGTAGALVAEVTPDTPAAQAGLKEGDVVLSLDGTDVDSPRMLSRRIADIAPGKSVTLSVWRDGARQDIAVTTAELPADDRVASAEGTTEAPAVPKLGLGLEQVTPDQRTELGLDADENGVVVVSVEPDSQAAEKGLEPGDVILSADFTPVAQPDDVRAALAQAESEGKAALLLLVSREGQNRFVAVPLTAS